MPLSIGPSWSVSVAGTEGKLIYCVSIGKSYFANWSLECTVHMLELKLF